MKQNQTLARVLTAAVLAIISLIDMNAQNEPNFWWRERQTRENAQLMAERTQQMLDTRKDNFQTLSLQQLVDDCEEYQVWWWDGQSAYCLGYTDNDKNRILAPFDQSRPMGPTLLCKKSGKTLSMTVKGHPGWTVAYQSIGPWKLLVIRDEKRRAQDCYIQVKQHYFMDIPDVQTLTMHDLFDGVYQATDGKKAVFGPLLSHYTDLQYARDPGIFSVEPDEKRNLTGRIKFGDGRVSRGNPNSPKYGKMPGGGGAGAIMGPMEWEVSTIPTGLHVKITNDEPFVEHNPRFDEKEFDLQRIQDAYPDLPGIYSVASVRPLTKGMLLLLPKGDLLRMNNEVPDRHIDGSRLTDIEQLNLDLISLVLSEK